MLSKSIDRPLFKSLVYTLLLTAIYIPIVWENNSVYQIISSSVYVILLYFVLFSVGKPEIGSVLNKWIDNNVYKIGLLPVVLLVLYYSYLIINGQNPFEGINMFLPFFVLFPSFVLSSKVLRNKLFDWMDFTILVMYIFPITWVEIKTNSNLPVNGDGLDSVYRIIIMITGVYSFAVIRNMDDVGFYPQFNLKKLWTAIWIWVVFYSGIYFLAISVNFLKFKGHEFIDFELIFKIIRKLLSTFLHIALFEELVFRGLLLNMLQKRIEQTNTWKSFWYWGAALLFVLSVITGYTMEGSLQWFPALVSVGIFGAAYLIEKQKFDKTGTYTALAISSIIFGLVHYHAGSIIFVGIAGIAGWAYGYTYIKTKNVFYAALVHTLVNTSALIFGFELMK